MQIDKLIKAGADILAPIPIGPKRIMGTAVDYAYYMYNLDRRIAHMPYHALTHAERETFNARRKLLAHLGDILRTKAVEREKRRIEEEENSGQRSRHIFLLWKQCYNNPKDIKFYLLESARKPIAVR